MDNNKLFLIVFVCIAVVLPIKQSIEAGSVSTFQQEDVDPCDTCPHQGKCVPKVSCPAHVRPGYSNHECHLKSGHIGICCYTKQRHAAKSEHKKTTRSSNSRSADANITKAYFASKAMLKKWFERSRNVLKYSDTIVSAETPDYGHQLSLPVLDEETEKLGEGALLNLFAAQELMEQQASDGDEPAVEFGEAYEGPYCPPQPTCMDPLSPYRSVNGECNNLEHPTWGAANTGYERLLSPAYSDGFWAFRTSKCEGCAGEPLPSPRAISAGMLLDGHYPSDLYNFMCSQFGQFVTHDITSTVIFSTANGSAISCCSKDGGCLPPEQLHYACAPIAVDPEDEFFSHFHKTCLNFVRAQLAPSLDCSSGYAKQMNGATHFLDLSQLYGDTKKKEKEMRAPGGYLKVFNDYGRELPPLTDRPECLVSKGACFDTGDRRGNQLISLTVLHTMWTREHNRIVRELTRLNPDCDGDTTFNLAKRILQAMFQHIVYNEWLPLIIGPELMEIFDLGATFDGYATCYDPGVNPSLVTEFAAGSMRFGHSTVVDNVKVGRSHSDKASEYISVAETMFEPSRMRLPQFHDQLLKGMVSQPMERVDPFFTFGLTRYMFRSGNAFGLDLASLNLQRGRDCGNQPYNEYRKLCGLKSYNSIKDFPLSAQERLSAVYGCSDDIDLWLGGILEEPVTEGIVGPTFACIIAEQFSRLKKGDRYYYEHRPKDNPGAFTPSQLAQLKNSNMARIICDNLDKIHIKSMPPRAFFRSDLPGNEPLQCDDPAIPSIDLSCFKTM